MFGSGMFQSIDRLDAEVMLQHGSGHTLLKTRYEHPSGELFLFFLLFIEEGAGHLWAGESDVGGEAAYRHHTTRTQATHHGIRVQLFHGF